MLLNSDLRVPHLRFSRGLLGMMVAAIKRELLTVLHFLRVVNDVLEQLFPSILCIDFLRDFSLQFIICTKGI